MKAMCRRRGCKSKQRTGDLDNCDSYGSPEKEDKVSGEQKEERAPISVPRAPLWRLQNCQVDEGHRSAYAPHLQGRCSNQAEARRSFGAGVAARSSSCRSRPTKSPRRAAQASTSKTSANAPRHCSFLRPPCQRSRKSRPASPICWPEAMRQRASSKKSRTGTRHHRAWHRQGSPERTGRHSASQPCPSPRTLSPSPRLGQQAPHLRRKQRWRR